MYCNYNKSMKHLTYATPPFKKYLLARKHCHKCSHSQVKQKKKTNDKMADGQFQGGGYC